MKADGRVVEKIRQLAFAPLQVSLRLALFGVVAKDQDHALDDAVTIPDRRGAVVDAVFSPVSVDQYGVVRESYDLAEFAAPSQPDLRPAAEWIRRLS